MRLNPFSDNSLATNIIIGLVLGIPVGLFFGEMIGWLTYVSIAYIKLLQMTVLPYIVVSLISSLGKLSFDQLKGVVVKVGLVMLVIWILGFLVIFLMPLVLPEWVAGSFYSVSAIQPEANIDYYDLYIPSNPFHSLAENAVPAVVLFSIAVGVALIKIEKKDALLSPLEILSKALVNVTNFIVRFMPFGVFAISASTAGTISIEEFGRLQTYFIIYILASMILAFWFLPRLLSIFTPFKYGDVVGIAKDALITAFATGNLFVVLPVLTEHAKTLIKKYAPEHKNAGDYAEIIIPVSFNFPNLGKVLALFFIIFAGWYTGNPLSVSDYPILALSGLFSIFGSLNLAIPFLLDSFKIPADMFQLFTVVGLVTVRFATLLAAMNLLVLTLASMAMLTGVSKFQLHKLIIFGLISTGLMIILIFSTKFVLQNLVDTEYKMDKVVKSMRVASKTPVTIKDKLELSDIPAGKPASLDTILERGELRVGFNPEQVPFSYFNQDHELVGFDIELMKQLERDLDIKIKFVPYTPENVIAALESGKIDVIVSGLQSSAKRLKKLSFTKPLMDLHLALVVKDHRREQFRNRETLHLSGPLTIATVGNYPYMDTIKSNNPNIEFKRITADREYFDNKTNDYDALLISLEAGMAWTILKPEYEAVVYKEKIVRFPMSYGVARDNFSLVAFLNRWIDIQLSTGTIQQAKQYWIQGQNVAAKVPRWSIIRDVLHWID
ncbi:cation:dicarboxylate symporter family transporter [Pseudomonadota bacterium]